MIRPRFLAQLLLFVVAFAGFEFSAGNLCVCAQEQKQTVEPDLSSLTATGQCMGPIPYRVSVVDPPGELDQKKLEAVIQGRLDHINELMSTYVTDSDVSRFNQAKAGQWVSVDVETVTVVARANEISKLTKGAFDITVGPAVNLWKFGPDKDNFEVPEASAVKNVASLVGYDKVKTQAEPPALKKTNDGIRIDLSAIAKGYAVDLVLLELKKLGCENVMVEVGGEVRCCGHRVTREPWRVAVRKPDAPNSIDAVAELVDRSMATSGDYENYKKVESRRYSHTIDPTTCRPVEHHLASACVIAPDCMTADALATAAMVMGLERAKTFFESQSLDYFLVERESDFGRTFTKVSSKTFPVLGGDVTELNSAVAADQEFSQSILPVFVGSLIVFALVIVSMAVGAIFNNKPVQGSCGGLANMTNEDGESSCAICSKPTSECVELPENSTNATSNV